jgi:exoribonuclease R
LFALTANVCRYDAGALNLASPEVKFKLDTESNSPLDVGMYQQRDTNAMVEEMMLMANCTVAAHIHRAFPSCAVLRKHEPPTPEMFEPLIQVSVLLSTPASFPMDKSPQTLTFDLRRRLHLLIT